MVFNTLPFLLFLPAAFVLYWLLRRADYRWQNLMLVGLSLVFYGWWDWRFLPLLVGIALVDYLVGRGLAATEKPGRRKLLLGLSLAANLGALAIFKYSNFFIDSFASLLRLIGLQPNIGSLEIILPLGLVFFTLRSLTYTIDVYKGKLKPSRDPIAYLAFVSFFPHLLAGPIERARYFLPQLERRREFDPDHAADGLRQMLWGFVKKVVVADMAAQAVNAVFLSYHLQDTPTLIAGLFLFAVQLYGDFSGYSDIAVGTARLFGFKSVRNFAYPYFSRNVAEFWRRWHISLMSWFREYVFYPLGGPMKGKGRWILNTLVVFAVSGLWHGSDWTFVAWGLLNGLYFIPLILRKNPPITKGTVAKDRLFPSLKEALQMLGTFLLIMLSWVFFRAETMAQAWGYLKAMVTNFGFGGLGYGYLKWPVIASLALLLVEWFQRKRRHTLRITKLPRWLRWIIYYALIAILIFFGTYGSAEFIYMQF